MTEQKRIEQLARHLWYENAWKACTIVAPTRDWPLVAPRIRDYWIRLATRNLK